MNKAMILAAGYGTRLKPITDSTPKALVPFKNGTMISYQIEKLKSIGIKEIIVNAHHFSERLIKYFQEIDFGVKIVVIAEEDILGTGGGVLNAKEYLQSEDYFLVLNVDVFTNFNIELLIREYESTKPFALLAVQKRKTSRYLEFDSNFHLKGRVKSDVMEENYFAFNGMHIISNDIFSANYKNDYKDILDVYLEEKKHVKGFDVLDSVFIDLGKTENLKQAEESGD
ncbi:MAG: sugar phosphate nucleotidyltransferase [Ignavibacteriota bacterium]|nr:sugar phosphate nucleotidyltransferase [Ignavibacteriota bacterium]